MSSEPCAKCLSFLAPKQSPPSATKEDSSSTTCCPICLGLWDADSMQSRLESAIRQTAEPYGGCSQNRFTRLNDNDRLLSVPGDIIYRYHSAARIPPYKKAATRLQVFVTRLKQHANELLATCLDRFQPPPKEDDYPDCVDREEQGYLGVNVLMTTPLSLPRPARSVNAPKSKKARRKQYVTQGGHPRASLERKLQLDAQAAPLWPLNAAVELCERSQSEENLDWFWDRESQTIKPVPTNALRLHVALWRRPFWIQGRYTKTRRDVSQSPFFVNNGPKRQRLGITSIEELISPALVTKCGGISILNNLPPDKNTSTVYGMAKFHASGREDMDVRMILPTNFQGSKNITGRPFCCEMVDALRMPTVQDLEQVVHTINHNRGDGEEELLAESTQYYGISPLGVGVDPNHLSFAQADTFKNLQSETEEKHKFYGCLCWSEHKLPPLKELIQRLTTMDSSGTSRFPIELKQRTPIRVLHRRANAIRIRHILSCHDVERLDDHYFRIHISTDAGTYVKEFCHGDLGRTQPNVSTLLGGGKIDILELDCEGIQINQN